MVRRDADPAARKGKRAGRARAAGWAVAGLAALAVAQPAFHQVARHPAFLAEHGAGPSQVLLLALALGSLALPPAWLASRRGSLGRRARGGLLALLAAALFLPLGLRLPFAGELPGLAALALALAAGLGVAAVFERSLAARTFLSYLGLAALAVPLVFLFSPSVGPFWWPAADGGNPAADLGAPDLPRGDLQVVVVVFDELPASVLYGTGDGRIDARRFPAFAELERSSRAYGRAYSVAGATEKAMPSLLTGRYPEASPAGLIAAEFPNNLFSLTASVLEMRVYQDQALVPPEHRRVALESSGTAAMLQDLSLVYLHWLLPADAREGLPPLHGGWTDLWSRRNPIETTETAEGDDVPGDDVPGDDVPGSRHVHYRLFRDFVRGLESSERPALHYAHPLLPHQPWTLLPDGRLYNDPWTTPMGVGESGSGHQWGEHPWSTLQAYHRLLLQTAATDALLGELLRKLEGPAWRGRTLLAVTADHGIGFRPGGGKREGPMADLASEILWVPFFLRLPESLRTAPGALPEGYAEVTDLVPSILDALGFDPGRVAEALDLDGVSLLRPVERRPEDTLFAELYGEAGPTLFRDLDRWALGSRQRRSALFGTSGGLRGRELWWRVGPSEALRELLGREVSELPAADAPGGPEVVLERPRIYERVDLRSRRLPAWLHVELRGAVQDRESVAVALHGTVVAVTESRRERGAVRASALLPPHALRPGENQPELFLVRRGALQALRRFDAISDLGRRLVGLEPLLVLRGEELAQLDVRALGSARLELTGDGVVVRSEALRPTVELRLPGTGAARHLVLRLDVSSETTTALGVRWQNPGDPGFRRGRHAAADLLAGPQVVEVEIVREEGDAEPGPPPELAMAEDAAEAAEVWQIELGRPPGRYVLHGVEVYILP